MLSYSTLGLPEWDLENLCLLLGRFGFGGIEIALTPDHVARRSDDRYWTRAKETAAETGMTIVNLHLGNPRLNPDATRREPTLLNDDAAVRRRWTETMLAACEIAGRLGCERLTVLSGPPNPNLDIEAAWRRLVEQLKTPIAECPPGCSLLLEHEPEHFVRSTDDLLRLHRETGGRVQTNLDVGHLEVLPEPIGPAIERLGKIIRNVHLEDIKDHVHRHLLPGDGDIDFAEVGRALKKIGYDGPLTADLYPFADRPIVAIKRAYEAFSELV